MTLPRSAGILLHPTSLPGPNGVGELGHDALVFLDFLETAGITLWQVLPLGPTGYGDSPYQCFSAFAGNPLLIDVPGNGRAFEKHSVDFEHVIPYKRALLDAAIASWKPDDAYRAFVAEQSWWLDDYAMFMASKDAHGGAAWTEWEPSLAAREASAMTEWRTRLAHAIERYRVEQYFFYSQFDALHRAARSRGIRIMGDLPIYVAHDSADVWANPKSFKLRPDGRPLVQAGVPPDYFSATGQLWGNPIYDWDAMKADGYSWWIRRLRHAFASFDVVRIDHFRGFEAYWEVPGDATTAQNGEWVKGPGASLFDAVTKALGPLPIVAENLGVITPAVEALREQFGYPGMGILQFAFGAGDEGSEFRPHNYTRETVVYTGTHDNDTTIGWWTSTGEGDSTRSAEDVAREKAFAMEYLGTDGKEMNWAMIRAVLASVANTVIIPMQDVLGLGSEARLNLPGRASGNWQFRFSWDQLTPEMAARLHTLIETYQR
jgi:4-alpha-glucanotransferase